MITTLTNPSVYYLFMLCLWSWGRVVGVSSTSSYSAMRNQKTVTAYFTNKQLLHLALHLGINDPPMFCIWAVLRQLWRNWFCAPLTPPPPPCKQTQTILITLIPMAANTISYTSKGYGRQAVFIALWWEMSGGSPVGMRAAVLPFLFPAIRLACLVIWRHRNYSF